MYNIATGHCSDCYRVINSDAELCGAVLLLVYIVLLRVYCYCNATDPRGQQVLWPNVLHCCTVTVPTYAAAAL